MNRLPLCAVLLSLAVGVVAQTPPDLQVFLSTPRRVDPGLPYTISAGYTAFHAAATGVRVTVTISAGRFVTVPERCTVSGLSVTCDAGRVAPAEFPSLPLLILAPDEGDAEIAITATIAADAESNTSNNSDAETIRTFRTVLVTNTNDSGSGSLRAAIDEANATCTGLRLGEICKIAFRIPVAPARWATIRPETPLPPIVTSGVMIDGSTQTRAADTNPLGPEIELSGARLASGNGVVLAGRCGAYVHDLVINGFPDNGVYVGGADCPPPTGPEPAPPGGGIRAIVGNYIGTDPTGTAAVPNLRGIFVAPDPPFVSPVWITHNVISGNRYSGVWIAFGSDTSLFLNKIGLNATATAGLGNGASGVYVGAAGGGVRLADNHIGFNGHYGVAIAREAARVQFSTNSFQANGNLAVDYGLDGVTPSLPDSGVRAGRLVHAPVLTSARYDAASDATIVDGTIDVEGVTIPCSIFVTLYANDAPDASGFGEGQYLLGRADVDRDGRFRFVYRGRTPGLWIAALTTSVQPSGRGDLVPAITSSEFSRTLEVTQ